MAKSKKKAAAKVSSKSKAKAGRTVARTSKTSGAGKSAKRANVKTGATGSRSSSGTGEGGAVLEYKLFVEDSVRGLEDQVNYYIGKGWAPVGGVVVQTGGNFMQSMVRRQA